MKRTLKFTTFIAILVIGFFFNEFTENIKRSNTATLEGNITLAGNGIIYEGLLSPGNSPGKITVSGDFTMGNSATYKCEIKDLTGGGSGHDQIDITGDVNLNGTLDIVLDGYTPSNNDEFQIMKFGENISGTFSTINWPTSMQTDGWKIDYGVLVPNRVTIYGNQSEIPIELLSFYLIKNENSISILWETASEKNTDYFDVEHSINGNIFSSIQRINAQGTSYNKQRYSFEHHTPTKGNNYYRLKQVDLDGKFIYSNIISVILEKGKITFFPNPVNKSITFNQPCDVIVIYDISGKEILYKEKVTSNLDISLLKSGIYFIDVNNGEYKDKIIIK